MKRRSRQSGFTLIELLVVAAIIMILAASLLGVGRRILTAAQERLARSTLDILVSAVEQYQQEQSRYPMQYRGRTGMLGQEPISVTTAFTQADLVLYLNDDLGLNRLTPTQTVAIQPLSPIRNDYAISECLYYFLDRSPGSRRLIASLADSQKTAIDASKAQRLATWSPNKQLVLMRFVDPWGTAIRYEFTPGQMTVPRLTSAGPDRTFDTADDLRSDS
jgi:prepilin-type N-terminal cleavage/methylation domain-containing protein